jgi:hypothetical protein
MRIERYLSELRTKPEHIRRRFAFWTSLGITFVIFVFWLSSFSRFGVASRMIVAYEVRKAGTPAESLVAAVGSFFVDIKDLVFGAKKMTYSSVEIAPGNK